MNDLLQQKRALEDQAISLGERRQNLNADLQSNTHAMIEMVRRAEGMIPIERLASFFNVSRQTIYNWREWASSLPANETVEQALSKRTAEGHLLHFKG
jgi:hypothetical protein